MTFLRTSNGVNKYYIILVFFVILVIFGISYQQFQKDDTACPPAGKKKIEIAMRALENQWTFTPNPVIAERCDNVTLKIFNEDAFDHGFAIDTFGINKRLAPKTITEVKFIATQIGAFQFYCSVPCGEGIVSGVKRGHLDQTGTIIVK